MESFLEDFEIKGTINNNEANILKTKSRKNSKNIEKIKDKDSNEIVLPIAEEKKVEEESIKLTKEQTLQVELKLEQRKSKILELKRWEDAIKNARLEYKIAEMQLKEMNNRINGMVAKMEEEKISVDNFNKSYKAFISELSKTLKLDTTKWGFHPDTGAVIKTN